MNSKKKRIQLFSIIIFVLFLITFLFRAPIKSLVRDYVPEKTYLRLSWIKSIITSQDFGFYKYEVKLGDQYSYIYDYINTNDFQFSVDLIKKGEFNIFKVPPIFPAISVDEVNTAYIDFYNKDLIYATKNGIFFKVQNQNDKLLFKPLKSNISDFLKKKFEEKKASINYFNPYTVSKFGLKDIFVDDDDIYVSYIETNPRGDYNIAIIKSKLSDSLVFTKFFSPRNYISSAIKEFSPIQSGGRITNFKSDSLLLSIGDFRDRTSAQDYNLDNGKIIAINKINSDSRIISLGHRNPQGLDYSDQFDYILSSEHGPAGGDEINLNLDTDIVKNFGWPISSYGVHYSLQESRTGAHGGDSKRVIKSAPIYKSHSDYGYIEPIKYYEVNPAVSEIRIIKENESYIEFILSSLGYDTIQRPYSQSLIHYKYDFINQDIELVNQYKVGERIRDLLYESNSKKIYYVGESTGVLGYINLNL